MNQKGSGLQVPDVLAVRGSAEFYGSLLTAATSSGTLIRLCRLGDPFCAVQHWVDFSQ